MLDQTTDETNKSHRDRIQNGLASAMYFDGRLHEAVSAFHSLAASTERPVTAGRALNNAAEALRTLGQLNESVEVFESALEAYREAAALDEPSAVSARFNLGSILADLGRDTEALEHLKAVVCQRRQLLGCESGPTQSAKLSLAVSLCRTGNYRTAEQLLREQEPASDETLCAAFALVGAMIDLHAGRIVKAELALLRLSGSDALPDALTAEACRLLAEIYRREERPDESSRWMRVAVDAIDRVASLTPANAARTYLTAASVEELAERWSGVVVRLDQADVALAWCGASLDEERIEAGRLRAMATRQIEAESQVVPDSMHKGPAEAAAEEDQVGDGLSEPVGHALDDLF